VTLLPAGKNFLARAQAILHELSLAVEEARDINVGHSGSVRIGFVSTAAPRVIPELLHPLRRKYPRIQVDLYETDPHDQVQQLHWLKIDNAAAMTIEETVDEMQVAGSQLPAQTASRFVRCSSAPAAKAAASSCRTWIHSICLCLRTSRQAVDTLHFAENQRFEENLCNCRHSSSKLLRAYSDR
jgi:DNA-binding transcriptional LysR family regulator